MKHEKAERWRLGDVFTLTDSDLQPATLPIDETAAVAELKELHERNRTVLVAAKRGHKQLFANPKGRTKKSPGGDQLWAECQAEKARRSPGK